MRALVAVAALLTAVGCGDDTDNPMECTPAGVTSAPEAVADQGVAIGYSSTAIAAPGSDCTGLGIGCDTSVRLGVFGDGQNPPPAGELDLYVNGCAVGKLDDPGEEYFWTSRDEDTKPAPAAGSFLVVEVTRSGHGIILRRSFQMPPVMPALTSPAPNAAITAPTQLAWTPVGLDALADTETAELSVTAWRALGGGAQTDGYIALTDGDGSYTWQAGSPDWTHLELQAAIAYSGGLSFYLNYFQPVNN